MFTDGKAFGAEIVAIVKDYVAASLVPVARQVEDLRALFAAFEPLPGPAGPQGQQGFNGSDGVGLASAFIDHSGCLVITMTDGTVGSLGKVVADPIEKADPATINDVHISQELGDDVAKAIAKLSESPPLAAKANGGQVINLNITERGLPPAKKKLISTRRDEAGNLVADVVEQDA